MLLCCLLGAVIEHPKIEIRVRNTLTLVLKISRRQHAPSVCRHQAEATCSRAWTPIHGSPVAIRADQWRRSGQVGRTRQLLRQH